MRKIIILLLSSLSTSTAWADLIQCQVDITDMKRDTKYVVPATFDIKTGTTTEYKDFLLPGSSYECGLGVFKAGMGTNLYCGISAERNHWVRSDRTVVRENPSLNNLSVKLKGMHYELHTKCKYP